MSPAEVALWARVYAAVLAGIGSSTEYGGAWAQLRSRAAVEASTAVKMFRTAQKEFS